LENIYSPVFFDIKQKISYSIRKMTERNQKESLHSIKDAVHIIFNKKRGTKEIRSHIKICDLGPNLISFQHLSILLCNEQCVVFVLIMLFRFVSVFECNFIWNCILKGLLITFIY